MSKDILAKLFKEDGESLVKVLTSEFSTLGSDGKSDSYSTLNHFNMIAYQAQQGFDHSAVLAILLKDIGDDEYEARLQDIKLMVQIGLERGNNIDKMMTNSSEVLIKKIREFKAKYNLVKSANGNKKAVTLSRVAIVFPYTACCYMAICKNPTVPFMKMDAIVKNYPRCMMTGAFGGVIPSNDTEDVGHLIKAHLIYQFEFSKVVTPDKTELTHDYLVGSATKYLYAARNGSILPHEKKLKYLEEWGIYKDSKATEIVIIASKVWDSVYMAK